MCRVLIASPTRWCITRTHHACDCPLAALCRVAGGSHGQRGAARAGGGREALLLGLAAPGPSPGGGSELGRHHPALVAVAATPLPPPRPDGGRCQVQRDAWIRCSKPGPGPGAPAGEGAGGGVGLGAEGRRAEGGGAGGGPHRDVGGIHPRGPPS